MAIPLIPDNGPRNGTPGNGPHDHLTREDLDHFRKKLADRAYALREEIRATLLAADSQRYTDIAGQVRDLEDDALADRSGRARSLPAIEYTSCPIGRSHGCQFLVFIDSVHDCRRYRWHDGQRRGTAHSGADRCSSLDPYSSVHD